MKNHDVVIIGAGAAGLMCAIEAGKRGRSVLVMDHASKPAEKIRISGGGRCNFTNLHITPKNFLSQNPSFCVSALTRYTPHDFIALIKKHHIAFHEKTQGQLFCDGSAREIIAMLLVECERVGVQLVLETTIHSVGTKTSNFSLSTSMGELRSESLVIASGGLSIPKMGATGFGYDIARQFGLPIVPPTPALVPFVLSEPERENLASLSGIALEASMKTSKQVFHDGMLFTHRGLSGPAALQLSSYWQPSDRISINVLPHLDLRALLVQMKTTNAKQDIATVLAQHIPKRIVQTFLSHYWPPDAPRRLADISDKRLAALAEVFQGRQIVPVGTEGYRTAEVTRGGVDTAALSSKTMQCLHVAGLYFIGEVVDVTGHLGGFNFQWAWSSGYAAGQYV
ncbi:MAG: NAD(P)/FAD-dependent oxidoreductase [Rickettsiales bacterium]|nr:NAD(P)/FAD-dependent oxidoreductase [Rickettsiales bacterium]